MAWSAERKAGTILSAIAAAEGWWVWINLHASPERFFVYTGFRNSHAGTVGWLLALSVFAVFTTYSVRRFPSVRATLVSWSALKVLALAVAITAGFCEEAIFRKWLMDRLAHAHYGVTLQVLASALAFGLLHGVWGAFRGSIIAAMGATIATGALGCALAAVYLMSHRVLAPCILSHFLINVFVEPGLVLAAVRGEISRP